MRKTTLWGAVLLAGCAGCNGSNDMVFQYNDAKGQTRVNFAWQNKYSSGIPEESYQYRRNFTIEDEQDPPRYEAQSNGPRRITVGEFIAARRRGQYK